MKRNFLSCIEIIEKLTEDIEKTVATTTKNRTFQNQKGTYQEELEKIRENLGIFGRNEYKKPLEIINETTKRIEAYAKIQKKLARDKLANSNHIKEARVLLEEVKKLFDNN